MPNIELIAELKRVQNLGTSGYQGLSQMTFPARMMLRKAQMVGLPAMATGDLKNNVAVLALVGEIEIAANQW